MVRRSDEGCSATQKLDFLRSRHLLIQKKGTSPYVDEMPMMIEQFQAKV